MPRTTAPRTALPAASIACAWTKGAVATTRGCRCAICAIALPVGEPVAGADDLHVRGDAEDARAHFLLEAVHHRQHHDQRPHADRDADHRDERS